MRRCARWIVSALCVLGVLACEQPTPRDAVTARLRELDRPHVVLIVVDTLRADWTSPYGGDADTTPELARWASRGIVFERALAQSSWTKVSMASLLTSLWPRTLGVRETTDGLGDGPTTLAEAFRKAGYATYAVQSNGWLEQTFGFHRGFDRYMFPTGGESAASRPSLWPHADNIYREAERLIDARPDGTPLFLYLHFMDVHEYASPPELRRFGSDDRGHYRAAMAWVDEVLARLRARLERKGLLDHTILVLASDHGETFGENGVTGHARNVRTPVLHVPLVVRLPFRTDAIRVASQVRNLDVAPTLVDLAGLPVPEEWEGESLLPLLAGDAGALPDRPSYASLTALLYRDARLQESMTDGDWTFARDADGGRPLLFDRRVDPGENVNLAAIETEQARRMAERLDTYLEHVSREDAVQTDVRIDPGLAQKLRALGYLRD